MRYLLAALLMVAFSLSADARRSDRGTAPGQVYGFAYSQCKSAYCFGKHPEGRWLHPLTVPYGRRAYR